MDCPDNIQYIQKTLDDLIRERNELCQANEILEKREKQLKSRIDNFFYQCKQKRCELLQEEEINRELLTEITRLKKCVEQLKGVLGERVESIKQFERVVLELEKLQCLVCEQKDVLKEMQREYRNLKDSLKDCESAQQNLSAQIVLKVDELRKEIKCLKEAEKILKSDVDSLENDHDEMIQMVLEMKKDFEDTCDQLTFLESHVCRYKETENKLEIQIRDRYLYRDKLLGKVNDQISFQRASAQISRQNNNKSDSNVENKCKLSMTVEEVSAFPSGNKDAHLSSNPRIQENKPDSVRMMNNLPRESKEQETLPKILEGNNVCIETPIKMNCACSCSPSSQDKVNEESRSLERRVHFAPSQANFPNPVCNTKESPTYNVLLSESPISILKNADRPSKLTESVSSSKNCTDSSQGSSKTRFQHRKRLKRRECIIQ